MPLPDEARPIEILLVEDNPADARLAREVLADGKLCNTLHHVGDGEQALEFLHRRGDYRELPRPDLVLLDLNLPRKNGHEVLAEMKQDEELRSIPVVVFTSSKRDEDVVRSYNLHANCFVTKPIDLDQFLAVVGSIEEFWLTVVRLPHP